MLQHLWVLVLIIAMGLLLLLYLGLRSRARGVVELVRQEHGGAIRLLTGCGLVYDLNRVPGLLVLLPDRLLYRATLTAKAGEIPLQEIAAVIFEETGASRHRRVRKYRGAEVLEVTGPAEPVPLFVLRPVDASSWREALTPLVQLDPQPGR